MITGMHLDHTRTLRISKGTSETLRVYLMENGEPLNLAADGWSAILRIRDRVADEGGPVLYEASTANGRILLGFGAPNEVRVQFLRSATASWDFSRDNALYELVTQAPDGTRKRRLDGVVVLERGAVGVW